MVVILYQAGEAKVKISEVIGDRVDNKTKLEIIKQEQEIIKMEQKEREKEEKLMADEEKQKKEEEELKLKEEKAKVNIGEILVYSDDFTSSCYTDLNVIYSV